MHSLKPEDFIKYPKIQSLYKRDDRGKFTDEYSMDEFAYLKDNQWVGTEKIHGTNTRLCYDSATGEKHILGRGNNTQMPYPLYRSLQEVLQGISFEVEFLGAERVILFGEGYGKGIQKPGKRYRSEGPGFILFDIWIDGWWLKREDIESISHELSIPVVPKVFTRTLKEAESIVKKGFKSSVAEDSTLNAEGLVLFPKVPLFTRMGNRIMTKLKTEDYK